MSVSTTIKQRLIQKVQNCPSVQKTYGYEQINPTGWPAVMITPTDMDGEFVSNAENSRVYAYQLLILFPIGQDMKTLPADTNRMEYAETTISTVIDEIINTVDNDFELGDTPVLYVNAADSSWGEYTYEGGVAKAAQLTLRIYTEHNVFN